MPKRRDAKLLQVLVRQARENRLVYVILAESCLILPEAQAPQPDHNVHDGAYGIAGVAPACASAGVFAKASTHASSGPADRGIAVLVLTQHQHNAQGVGRVPHEVLGL
jgi:hypothetical protein